MVTNEELMACIQRLNPTATMEFLKQFSRRELKAYLSRLIATVLPEERPAQAA